MAPLEVLAHAALSLRPLATLPEVETAFSEAEKNRIRMQMERQAVTPQDPVRQQRLREDYTAEWELAVKRKQELDSLAPKAR